MARDTTDETPISSVEEMAAYLASGCKPKDDWRIGTEHEKFPFFTEDNSPVPYDGERSIRALLEGMQKTLGWSPIMDEGRIIGLYEPTGMGAISLEPGGQFELSGAPLESIHQTCRESNAHLAQLRQIADPLGIKFLGLGASPKWTLAETPRMPKSRYDIMRAYMPKVGKEGLDMMHRTSTIQVNLDFASEADMRKKMQVSYRLQPIATALFANSPFTDGRPNGLLSWRANIWRDTDNDRAGVLPFVFADDFGFMDYTQWVLDVPMYFVLREGKYRDCTHVTFRQFMDGALEGEIPDARPNMGDWTNHLSTVFPEVRLKKFLEMRGADGGPWRRISGPATASSSMRRAASARPFRNGFPPLPGPAGSWASTPVASRSPCARPPTTIWAGLPWTRKAAARSGGFGPVGRRPAPACTVPIGLPAIP